MSGGAGTVGENPYNTRRSGDSTTSDVTETTASKSKKAPSCLILLGQLKLKATVSTKNKISNNAVAFEHLLRVRYFPKLFYSINTIPLVLPPHSTVWHAGFSGDQRACPNNTWNRELGRRWDMNSDLSTAQVQTANLPGREGRVASSALTFSKQSPYLATAFRVLAWSFFLQASFSLKRISFFLLQR